MTRTYNVECCSNARMKEILPFVTMWMGLEGLILGEISQTEKHDPPPPSISLSISVAL